MNKKTVFAVTALLVSTPVAAMVDDDPVLSMFKLEQFEWRDTDEGDALVWDGHMWIGRDLNKLWIKSEGERIGGETHEAELQLFYGRAVAPYWDLQVGVRRDFRPEPSRNWLGFGAMGVAPYWFEVDATVYVGEDGRSTARLEAEYELLFTQKLVLTPEIEVNLYGKEDPELGTGSGLSDLELGLRLRYEIRREFAPYIGVNWVRKFGGTADFARAEGEGTSDLQWVAGVRAWF